MDSNSYRYFDWRDLPRCWTSIDQKFADVVDGIHYDEEIEFLVVRLSSKHKYAVYKKRGKFA